MARRRAADTACRRIRWVCKSHEARKNIERRDAVAIARTFLKDCGASGWGRYTTTFTRTSRRPAHQPLRRCITRSRRRQPLNKPTEVQHRGVLWQHNSLYVAFIPPSVLRASSRCKPPRDGPLRRDCLHG
ncbi:hypothetical protein LIA77_11369 [Sarocladium implicatum]|nr:hypothetical protein LIA77_11369 [Sarocladium implicatum]